MPCTDDRDIPTPPSKEQIEALTIAVPMLCAIITHRYDGDMRELIEEILNVDAQALVLAGLTEAQAVNWWTEHKRKDHERMEDLRKQVMARLTPEEQRALGVR